MGEERRRDGPEGARVRDDRHGKGFAGSSKLKLHSPKFSCELFLLKFSAPVIGLEG